MEAYSKQQEHLYRFGAWVAWHTSALARVKKMPNFETFANFKKRLKPQTWEQQLGIIKSLNQAMGGKDLTNGK